MRLSLSLALWLGTLVLVVLGGYGWLQLRAEREDLESAASRELALVATAIASSVESSLRDEQTPDIVLLLDELDLHDPAVDVVVVGPGGVRFSSSQTGPDANGLASALDQPSRLRVERLDSGALAAVVPLRGHAEGRVVVVQPTSALQEDLHDEGRAIIVSAGTLLAALLSVIWLVVRQGVHVPMQKIISGVRQVRRGDLGARIGPVGAHEFGELAREFDDMAASLAAARLELATAAETREKLETELQRANRMMIVGELAATLAHEIGSPLQVLNGRARDLAARRELPPDALRSATIMVEQTDRVHEIVERLLGVARRSAPSLVELDPRALVEQMLELIVGQARRAQLRLELECASPARFRGDHAQMQQVLLNLLQNAIRATPPGGTIRVTITASTLLRADVPTRAIAIHVDDSGQGIAPDVVGDLFEPFFTAWTDDHAGPGTGLGLSVVKSIVRDHGGSVSVGASALGGARFTVLLPADP